MAVTSIVLTDLGEAWSVDRWQGLSTAPAYIGVGTGSTAAAKGDTTLGTEVESRVATSNSEAAADKLLMAATVVFTATRAMREAGVFLLVSGGTMLIRAVYDVINVGSGDAITYNFRLEQT